MARLALQRRKEKASSPVLGINLWNYSRFGTQVEEAGYNEGAHMLNQAVRDQDIALVVSR